MDKKKIKVSAVSYLNTLPFLHGINNSVVQSDLDLSLDIPSTCAQKLLNEEVNLGLVPVAVLPQLKNYHIVSNFCIGADGDVDSVALFSDVPLEEIEEIYLDYQSKTSVNLVKVLCKFHWNITPNFIDAPKGYENKIKNKVAGVIIGDRTFNLSKEFSYKYDLSGEWKAFTGLPFVFACWVSNIELPQSFIESFNEALELGVNSLDAVLSNYGEGDVSQKDLKIYLSQHISYVLDDEKHKAMTKFLELIELPELA